MGIFWDFYLYMRVPENPIYLGLHPKEDFYNEHVLTSGDLIPGETSGTEHSNYSRGEGPRGCIYPSYIKPTRYLGN